MQEGFLTTSQFANKYHVSRTYLYKLIKQGQCPGYYSGNRFNIAASALLEQMNKTESERNNMKS